MPSEHHCKKCNKDFKRAQDLKMHQSKVHKHKLKNASKKPQKLNQIDLISVLKVKIEAMRDVLTILENL